MCTLYTKKQIFSNYFFSLRIFLYKLSKINVEIIILEHFKMKWLRYFIRNTNSPNRWGCFFAYCSTFWKRYVFRKHIIINFINLYVHKIEVYLYQVVFQITFIRRKILIKPLNFKLLLLFSSTLKWRISCRGHLNQQEKALKSKLFCLSIAYLFFVYINN